MFGQGLVAPPGGWSVQKPPCGVPLNRAHPLAQGLCAVWPESEGSGMTLNDPAGGRALALSGTVWTATPFGTALSFNGSAFGVVGNTSVAAWEWNQPFSAALSLRPADVSSFTSYLGRMKGDATDRGWEISTGPGGYRNCLQFYLRNDITRKCAVRTTAASLSTTSWTTAVCTWLGTGLAGGLNIWINGMQTALTVLSDGLASSTVVDPSAYFTIGGKNGAGSFAGLLGPVFLWNRCLSPAEISRWFAQPYCMFEAGEPLAAQTPARPLIDGSLASGTSLIGAAA
jgi:hypothetical protein